jgi:hypothetical protein
LGCRVQGPGLRVAGVPRNSDHTPPLEPTQGPRYHLSVEYAHTLPYTPTGPGTCLGPFGGQI